MPVPAAPPTAQPRAYVARYFNAKAGKGMRMAHAKAVVSANTGFELFQAHASGTEDSLCCHAEIRVRQERLQTDERKQEQLAREKGQVRLVTRPLPIDPIIQCLDKKTRELRCANTIQGP
jgi:hypothetical protein